VLHKETSPWTERKEMRKFLLLRGSQVHNFSWKRRFEKMHVRRDVFLPVLASYQVLTQLSAQLLITYLLIKKDNKKFEIF
jgi:hypothetical protein